MPALPEFLDTSATFFVKPGAYTVDKRALADYYAFSSVKHFGGGQIYLLTLRAKGDAALEGGRSR